MYTIEKTFTGDLAHRIHNQDLDANFSGSSELKCRRLHGHTFSLKVKLGSEQLVDDMVIDYNELNFVKTLISDILDHRTLISMHDPIMDKIIKPVCLQYSAPSGYDVIRTDYLNAYKISTSELTDLDVKEFISSFTVVPFTTSSENIAKWIFEIIDSKISSYNRVHNTTVKAVSVSYKETPNSEAVYAL